MNGIEHTHDDDGNCVYVQQRLSWSFSWWDVAGVLTFGLGGVCKVAGQALDNLASEFSAAANYRRDILAQFQQQAAWERHRAQVDRELRDVMGIPTKSPEEES